MISLYWNGPQPRLSVYGWCFSCLFFQELFNSVPASLVPVFFSWPNRTHYSAWQYLKNIIVSASIIHLSHKSGPIDILSRIPSCFNVVCHGRFIQHFVRNDSSAIIQSGSVIMRTGMTRSCILSTVTNEDQAVISHQTPAWLSIGT